MSAEKHLVELYQQHTGRKPRIFTGESRDGTVNPFQSVDIGHMVFSVTNKEMEDYCRSIKEIESKIIGILPRNAGFVQVASIHQNDWVIGLRRDNHNYNMTLRGFVWEMSRTEAVALYFALKDRIEELQLESKLFLLRKPQLI